jgi:hypothetical protein
VKDPKRVAAGKVLAARNKERLARIKSDKKPHIITTDISTNEPSSLSNTQWSMIAGGACVILAGAATFCYWRGGQRPPSPSITKQQEPPARTTEVEDPFDFE